MGYSAAFLATVENLSQLRITDKAFWRIVDSAWEKPAQKDADKPNGMTAKSIQSWEDRRQTIAAQWTVEKTERGGNTAWNALQPFTNVLSNRTAGGNNDLPLVDRLEMRVMPAKGTVGGTAEALIDRVLDQIISSSTRTLVAAV